MALLFSFRITYKPCWLQAVIEKRNDQNDQQDQSQAAARVIAPTAAVRPSWEGAKRQDKKYYEQNKHRSS